MGESYVTGGAALTTLTDSNRISQDIDLFHDRVEAVESTFESDRALLQSHALSVELRRKSSAFIEARVRDVESETTLQWAVDSAYRFFPLQEHEEFGLVLHAFDLATNKTLALVGRLEPRDWIDVITCHERIQPIGYLAWAACGKDPGFGPMMILDRAQRSGRYTQDEFRGINFEGPAPSAAELSRKWHQIIDEAFEIVRLLPPDDVGKCVVNRSGDLYRGTLSELSAALAAGELHFHPGRLRGALPEIVNR